MKRRLTQSTTAIRLSAICRSLAIGLAMGLTLVVISGCAEKFSRDPQNICDYLANRSGWFKALELASTKWGVSQSLILAFIQHESLFDAEARPPRRKVLWIFPGPRRSSAYGYAQAIDGTWKAYVSATGNRKAQRDDFADATDFIGWYVSRNAKTTGISRDDAYQQYLIYHEGAGGFRRGSHNAKKWLLEVASGIRKKEKRYRQQLAQCTEEQKRPRRWWWPFR